MFARDTKRRPYRRPGASRPVRAPRRPRRSHVRSGGVRLPWKTLLAGTATAAMLAGAGYAALKDMNTAKADELGCYEQTAPQAHTVALVDSSEPRFDAVQRRDLMRAFGDVFQRDLAFNERFSLIATDASRIGSVPSPVVTRCGPARLPSDLESVGAASASDAFLERQAALAFEQDILPHLESVFAINPPDEQRQRAESPILEQIQSLSRMPAFSRDAGDKRLIVVSDLLQNTGDAQFCHTQGHLPAFETFRTRPYFERVAPHDLGGADVTVYLLIRGTLGEPPYPYCTEDELVRFWRAYFEDAGAGSVDVIRLRRGAGPASRP
jgi:hypothetical protein